ncbi:hypothetical protein PHMEG_00012431 [Phytophthora megakarya]|uniref:Uncharacterized protein n=1 Tax=Phytophthora megakarya TaxID=4795 RepID=A0A225W8Q1_9STRA|nr:hypothetical protein PHMEG_00012431 [Phytophthora megakarya]
MVSDGLCDRTLDEVERMDYKPLFKKVYPRTLDGRRGYWGISLEEGSAVAVIATIVADNVKDCNEDWEITSDCWHALMSLPGRADSYPLIPKSIPVPLLNIT